MKSVLIGANVIQRIEQKRAKHAKCEIRALHFWEITHNYVQKNRGKFIESSDNESDLFTF